MRKTIVFSTIAATAIALVMACSSGSSNNNSSSSVPTCQGSTGMTGAGSAACTSCLQSHCGSQISSLQSACGAYISCYAGCMCSDTMCLLNCVTTKIDSNCANAAGPENMCLQQNCQSQCSQTLGGTDGGTNG